MQCAYPIHISIKDTSNYNYKDKYNKFSREMWKKLPEHPLYPNGKIVPCGKCLLCRIAKTREWFLRTRGEIAYSKLGTGAFITLTYNDYNLPPRKSLVKKDLQNFFKRLRKKIPNRNIKYLACGEYGEKFDRPHYHFIATEIDGTRNSDDMKIIKECWPFGFVYPGIANDKTIKYVAGYINKKFYLKKERDQYEKAGRVLPFKLNSKGLGLIYLLKNWDILTASLGIYYNNILLSLPRYFVKKIHERESQINYIITKVKKLNPYNHIKLLDTTKERIRIKGIKNIHRQIRQWITEGIIKESTAITYKHSKKGWITENIFENYENNLEAYKQMLCEGGQALRDKIIKNNNNRENRLRRATCL